MTGTVFNVQKFSIHDGPGIRTTVFLKGCPLRCQWCHNPESNRSAPQLMVYPHLCTGCGTCLRECETGCISLSPEGRAITDRTRCVACGKCVPRCPAKAREIAGYTATVEEILQKVRQDKLYYRSSGGGMTVSGGEPLTQAAFTLELIKGAHQSGISTAIETCGYAAWETAEPVFREVDLILFDLKKMDPEEHRRLTGADNGIILKNLARVLTELGKPVWIRMPLIAGINDGEADIQAAVDFVSSCAGKVESVWLLPYHKLGLSKLEALQAEQSVMKAFCTPSREHLEKLAGIWRASGFHVQIA